MSNPLVMKLQRRFALSEADTSALERVSAYFRMVGPHIDLISEGDVPDHVHLIQRGFACRYKMLADGRRSIVAFLLPGDICDLNVSILGVMDHCIGTLAVCDVVRIPRAAMEDLTAAHPLLDRALRWAGLVDEAILREWLVNLGHRSAEKQMAHIFCEFLMRLQAVGLATENSYALPLRQTALSSATGLSGVHVNRTLQRLRGHGMIVFSRGHVTIPDVEAFKAFAEFNPNYLHLNPKGTYGRTM